jgi:hypothetical protein
MTVDDVPEATETRAAVAELSAYVRRLEQERRTERDPVRRRSLGVALFHAKAELLREWKRRAR